MCGAGGEGVQFVAGGSSDAGGRAKCVGGLCARCGVGDWVVAGEGWEGVGWGQGLV